MIINGSDEHPTILYCSILRSIVPTGVLTDVLLMLYKHEKT